MSQIPATITQIQKESSLHIVQFDFQGTILKMMSLELNPNIQVGTKVLLNIKPTHMALAKEFSGEVSYSNQIQAQVQSCEVGKLLASVLLKAHDIALESVITKDSCVRMNIQPNDTLTILIKASELSIAKVLS